MSNGAAQDTESRALRGLTPEQRAAETLKQEIRQRLSDCHLRRDSARRLAKKHRRRDALVLLESLLDEMGVVFAGLENGSGSSKDDGARASLGLARDAERACKDTERLSKKERRAMRGLDRACGKVLALGEQRFAAARRGPLRTPADGRRLRSRIIGWLVLASLLGVVALVFWGPLGNLLGPRSVNLVQDLDSDLVLAENLTGLEHSRVVSWRWGLGPQTKLTFRLDSDQDVRLTLRFVSYLYQGVAVAVNGESLAVIDHVFPEGIVEQIFEFRGREGVNEIVISYGDWNHRADMAPQADDPRLLAVAFVKLTVSAERRLMPVQ